MRHPNRRAYLKLLLPSILVFVFLQGAGFRQQETPPNSSVVPADIIILVDRSKSLDFVYDDVIDSVRFTLRYLETFDNGGKFRVSVIPFWGDVRTENTQLRRLRPEFWNEFNREIGSSPKDNTDFSRAFCQLQRTIENQQGPGIDRPIIVFLFSDGKSEPFGDTYRNDRRFSDCFEELQGTPGGYKSPTFDTELASDVFENIQSRNFLERKPTLYTVAFRTPENLENEDTLWWRNLSSDYFPFCTLENNDNECVKVKEKIHLLDFLSKVLGEELFNGRVESFKKSDVATIEIQPRRYSTEMRISVLGKNNVTLLNPDGRLISPIKSEDDFLIYSALLRENDLTKNWKLSLPLGTDYRINFVEPSLQFVNYPKYVWTEGSFSISIEAIGSGAERLPDRISIELVDVNNKTVQASQGYLSRYGKNTWVGTFYVEEDVEPERYTIHVKDDELASLFINSVFPFDVFQSPQFGLAVSNYDPKSRNWFFTIPIQRTDYLPENPVVLGEFSLIDDNALEKKVRAEIVDGKAILSIRSEDVPAGEYRIDVKLLSGVMKGNIITPEVKSLFLANMYVVPNIESVFIDNQHRKVEVSLSSYYEYKNLLIELVDLNDNKRRSTDLNCDVQEDDAVCRAFFPINLEDATAPFEYNHLILKGTLVSDSGREISLADIPYDGAFNKVPFSEAMVAVLRPYEDFLEILFPILVAIPIILTLLYRQRFHPQLVSNALNLELERKVGLPIDQKKDDLENYSIEKVIRDILLPHKIIPLPWFYSAEKKSKNLFTWLTAENSILNTETLSALEKVIDDEPRRSHRNELWGRYKETIFGFIVNTSRDLFDVFDLINQTKYKIGNRSHLLERAKDLRDILTNPDIHPARSRQIENVLRTYEFLLGIQEHPVNKNILENSMIHDPYLGKLFNRLSRGITMPAAVRSILPVGKNSNKIIVDFELNKDHLFALGVDMGGVSPTCYYLKLRPEKTNTESQLFCVKDFELAQGLDFCDWEQPLLGAQFRLIVDRPEKEISINLGIVGLDKEGQVLEITRADIDGQRDNDPSWFEFVVVKNAWGRKISYDSRLDIAKEFCDDEELEKIKNVLKSANLPDMPSNYELDYRTILRFGGWKILQSENDYSLRELEIFRDMCIDVIGNDINLNRFGDVRNTTYEESRGKKNKYLFARNFDRAQNAEFFIPILDRNTFEDNYLIPVAHKRVLDKILNNIKKGNIGSNYGS